MWQLFHALFGWHYIQFEFGFENTVRRVKTSPTGEKYVSCYGNNFFLNKDGSFQNRASGYRPLTFMIEAQAHLGR
jgi:hypothetical protein